MKVQLKSKSLRCEFCYGPKLDPITTCGDCDREYLMIDVRFYRALRAGTYRMRKLTRFEKPKSRKDVVK